MFSGEAQHLYRLRVGEPIAYTVEGLSRKDIQYQRALVIDSELSHGRVVRSSEENPQSMPMQAILAVKGCIEEGGMACCSFAVAVAAVDTGKVQDCGQERD